MRNAVLIFFVIISFFSGCGQTNIDNTADIDSNRLTCLVLGYDSIIYYTSSDSSSNIRQAKKGKLTDTIFTNELFRKVKDQDLLMVLKPGDGGNMISNFQEMINLANSHEITKRSIDTINTDEEKAFGFSTSPQIKATVQNQTTQPLKLYLPKDESDTSNTLSKFPKASQLTILISSDKNIYAYMSGYIQNGKKYPYKELTALLVTKRKDKNFSVIIKPAKSSSYKNIVDILDVMTTTDMRHYTLVDITKEEEDYISQLTW